jgi:uncharacterized phage protein gp47/JayE
MPQSIEPDSLELLPLYPTETEADIRVRWQMWANEGLTPEDAEDWVDTREGNFFSIATEPAIRECARLYDLIGTELPASTFPLFAWGGYLDDLGTTYKVERLAATPAGGFVTFRGAPGTIIGLGFTAGVEGAIEGVETKEYEVTASGTIDESGEITLPITAITAGSLSNAASGQINVPLSSPASGEITALSNEDPVVGGTDPESDEALRERLLSVFQGRGPGNIFDYEVWARSYSNEIGIVTVIPIWSGPGTVKVVVLTAEGTPVSEEVVKGLKAFLDPVAGLGHGQAPVGHDVTVATATQVEVTVAAKVTYEPGYSATGTGGTVALGEQIEEAIADYIRSEPPGGEVVLNKVIGRLTAFVGVHDVSAVKLNTKAENIKLANSPKAEVAFLKKLELS